MDYMKHLRIDSTKSTKIQQVNDKSYPIVVSEICPPIDQVESLMFAIFQ